MDVKGRFKDFCTEMRKYADFTDQELQSMFEAEMLAEMGDAMIACGF